MKKRKLLSEFILLLLFIVCSMTTVMAKESDKVSGKCGENVYWTYDREKHEMTIDGHGDMYAYDQIYSRKYERCIVKTKVLKIGKNVEKVPEDAFTFLRVENKVYVEVHGDMEKFERCTLSHATKIKLYGNADTLAASVREGYVKKIVKAKGNKKIKIKNKMVLSPDGKELYLYYGKEKDLKIPDNITRIRENAVVYPRLRKVTLGKKVREIDDAAFLGCYNLEELQSNKKLRSIGTAAFEGTDLKKITLPDKIKIGMGAFRDTKIKSVILSHKAEVGIMAFPEKTEIIPKEGIGGVQMSLGEAFYDDRDGDGIERIVLRWPEVRGADGYEIKLIQGDRVQELTCKKNRKTIRNTNFSFDDEFFVYYREGGYGIEYRPEPGSENPVSVRIRAYKKTKNGKKYGKWSILQVLQRYASSEA